MGMAEFLMGKKQACKCGSERFAVYHRVGGGGSGEYITLECSICGEKIEFDFENPDYEG